MSEHESEICKIKEEYENKLTMQCALKDEIIKTQYEKIASLELQTECLIKSIFNISKCIR